MEQTLINDGEQSSYGLSRGRSGDDCGKRLNIWLVTIGEPLEKFEPDARPWRTALLARVLRDRGHDVLWWSSTFNHSNKRHYVASISNYFYLGVRYILLHGIAYKTNVSVARLINHFQLARTFSRLAKNEAVPHLIVCSFPPIELSHAAVAYGALRNVPVILDVRDLWPDVFMEVIPKKLQAVGKIMLTPYFHMTRLALSRAAGFVAVSEGYMKWALSYANRLEGQRDAAFPLGYRRQQIPEADLSRALSDLRQLGIGSGKRIIWFIGSFGRSIDLAPVIEAAGILEQQGLADVQFVFSGSGEREEYWRRTSASQRNIIFTGWIDRAKLAALGSTACIGLQPYRVGASQGLANKLFEYLSFGLPTISSLQGENARFLAKHGCGLTYEAGNAESLVGALRDILGNPRRLAELKTNARETFSTHCCAEVIYTRYAEHLERAVEKWTRHKQQNIRSP